jgi:hypothetical protein
VKRNNIPFGILIGSLSLVIGIFAIYFTRFYPTFSVADFLKIILMEKTILSGISVFAIFANVVLITFYFNRRLDETAKGIFGISCLYAIAILIAKIFM